MNINLELSEKLAEIVEAENKECFKNSILALLALADGGLAKEPLYIEGCAIAYLPEAHAWVESDGEIIDVTYFGKNERYHHDGNHEPHEPVPSCTYFPGKRYSVDEIRSLITDKGILTPLFVHLQGEPQRQQVEAMKEAYRSLGMQIE